MSLITEIKEYFSYDPITGEVTWKKQKGTAKAGQICNTKHSTGYYTVIFKKHRLMVHRIAWILHYGTDPSIIDHINRIKNDNRISNLREVTKQENAENKDCKRKDSKQLYTGIEELPSGKFRARIVIKGKRKSLGTYKTAEEAHKVFLEYKETFHLYSK
jgi:hypothetical protein